MKKLNKFIFIAIFTISIILFCTNSYAYSSLTNFAPKYGTVTENVNLRNDDSTSSKIVKVLSKGTKIKILGKIDSFYIVQLGNNQVGTVYSSYVKSSSSAPNGAKTYNMITKKTGTINENNVNFRRGASTSFERISKLSKNTKVTVIGYIGDWYVAILQNGNVGTISKQYVTLSGTSNTTKPSNTGTTTNNSLTATSDEKIILDLINKARTEKGLNKLTLDSELTKIARLKAKDMVQKGYFSHTSPTYGSPFEMMKKYSISYKVAGENIAGNPSLENAVKAWLDSSTHRENILSTSYNLIGIGIEKSDVYGYIITTMFVGR